MLESIQAMLQFWEVVLLPLAAWFVSALARLVRALSRLEAQMESHAKRMDRLDRRLDRLSFPRPWRSDHGST